MACSTPVVEQIAVNILETISNVKVANGYNYDLIVQRSKKKEQSPEHLKCIIYQGDETAEQIKEPGRSNRWQAFFAFCYIMPREDDEISPDTYINVVKSDIMKALLVDTYRGVDCDNNRLAHLTEIEECITLHDDSNGEILGFVLPFKVKYRTSLQNPYQVN